VYDARPFSPEENRTATSIVDIREMTRQDQKKPWWERPATSPGEPRYVREREHLRAELARARRADGSELDRRGGRRQFETSSHSTAA
jgi:hypothetical protein